MRIKKRLISILSVLFAVLLSFSAAIPASAASDSEAMPIGSADIVGYATWSVELFTIGCGYLIYPTQVPIYKGETSADQLVRLLHDSGYVGYYGGSTKSAFYLGYIADGTASGTKYNLYQRSGTPSNPKKLNLSPAIPSVLKPHLQQTMTYFDPEDYAKYWTGYLGEFVFTNGSGWMFSVNNRFPNVGFADTYISDGDVIRVQFTLGYGADIGGLGSVGGNIPGAGGNQPTSGYYAVADKDALTKAICTALSSGLLERENVKAAYNAALRVAQTLDASQSSVNSATKELNDALENSGKNTDTAPPEAPPSTGASSGSDNSGNSGNAGGTTGTSSSGKSDNAENSTVSENSGNTSGASGSGNSGNKGGPGNSGNKSGTSGTTKPAPSTGESNASAETKQNKETNTTVPSIGIQNTSDPETTETENTNDSNTPSNIVNTDDNRSESTEDEIYTGFNGEKAKNSSFLIAGITAFVVIAIAAINIALYIRNRKIKSADGHETEGSNTND